MSKSDEIDSEDGNSTTEASTSKSKGRKSTKKSKEKRSLKENNFEAEAREKSGTKPISIELDRMDEDDIAEAQNQKGNYTVSGVGEWKYKKSDKRNFLF